MGRLVDIERIIQRTPNRASSPAAAACSLTAGCRGRVADDLSRIGRASKNFHGADSRSCHCVPYSITGPLGRKDVSRAPGSPRGASRSQVKGTSATAKEKKAMPATDREHDNERVIAQNRSARHEYEVLE